MSSLSQPSGKIIHRRKCSLSNNILLGPPSSLDSFYHPFEQDSDEQHLVAKGVTKKVPTRNQYVLSCGQCFTQLCFDGKEQGHNPSHFKSNRSRNCVIDCEKISVQKECTEFQVRCKTCENQVGSFDAVGNEFHFRGVLPS